MAASGAGATAAGAGRSVDDEGLPRPPPVRGRLSRWLLGAPLGRTMTELGVNAGVVVALSVALVLVRRFARLDRA